MNRMFVLHLFNDCDHDLHKMLFSFGYYEGWILNKSWLHKVYDTSWTSMNFVLKDKG